MEKENLNKMVECFRIGALVSTSTQSVADYIATGDKKQARADLLGMKDVLDESCIGKPFCDRLKQHIDSAVQALDTDKIEDAQSEVDEIMTISINNKPIKEVAEAVVGEK